MTRLSALSLAAALAAAAAPAMAQPVPAPTTSPTTSAATSASAASGARLRLADYLDWEDVQAPQLSPTAGWSCTPAGGWTS